MQGSISKKEKVVINDSGKGKKSKHNEKETMKLVKQDENDLPETAANLKAMEIPEGDNPSASEMDDSETSVQDLEQSLQDAEHRGFEDMP